MAEPARSRSRARARGRAGSPDEVRGRLKAHDPFELIRWLAYSQPDPRKALAELVQNSLDAGAGRIRVIRYRDDADVACLRIVDDGEGIIPEMDRIEALRYIATHIGHSRKRHLSPSQRLELMTQGQYGIGLLGFWSLGESLQMCTAVPGERPTRLVLYRDRPSYRIEPVPERLPLGDRWTEVVVTDLHAPALPMVGARRAADYLASELRGQLLARQVDLFVEDRIARGNMPRRVEVRPPRFLGEHLAGIDSIEVPGHPPVRAELYLREEAPPGGDGDGGGGIAVYAGGTLLAESFGELAAVGLDRPPWADPRLSGTIDFPALRTPPGSRRGVVPDDAARAFAAALAPLEEPILDRLGRHERQRIERLDRSLLDDLQRAFAEFGRHHPGIALLPVETRPGRAATTPHVAETPSGPVQLSGLLPPGPLAAVHITPDPIRVGAGGSVAVRAAAVDGTGRPVDDPVTLSWEIDGAIGELRADPNSAEHAVLVADDGPGEGIIQVTAVSATAEASATATVAILACDPDDIGAEGIPEPVLVEDPADPWRSRMADGRWEINGAHPDYRAAENHPRRRLRYLALLFAREAVLRTRADPALTGPLDQFVEIVACAERTLGAPRPPGRRRPDR